MITASELDIKASSSDEKDPYGQNGYFAISGTFLVVDKPSIERIETAFKQKSGVTIKCVLLEATGVVRKLTVDSESAKGTFSIDSIALYPVQTKPQVV